RLLATGAVVILSSLLRRQVLVVISQRSRRQDGRDGPSIIDLGRNQQKHQKVAEAFHVERSPPSRATTRCLLFLAIETMRANLNTRSVKPKRNSGTVND